MNLRWGKKRKAQKRVLQAFSEDLGRSLEPKDESLPSLFCTIHTLFCTVLVQLHFAPAQEFFLLLAPWVNKSFLHHPLMTFRDSKHCD